MRKQSDAKSQTGESKRNSINDKIIAKAIPANGKNNEKSKNIISDGNQDNFDQEFISKSNLHKSERKSSSDINKCNVKEKYEKTSKTSSDKIVSKRGTSSTIDSITSSSGLLVERVSDFSDPLRSAMDDDEVFETQRRKDSVNTMSEQQPFDNR